MNDDDLWKQRLAAATAVRFVGLVVFFIGIAVAYFDVLRPGGWPQVGAILAIVGAIDVIFAPRLLKKLWDKPER